MHATPGVSEAKSFLFASLTMLGFLACVVFLNLNPVLFFALPILLGLCNFLAFRLIRSGDAQIPTVICLVGVIYIVGGGAFDMIATIIHSPQLERESNPIARALLDQGGQPISIVYTFALVCQSLLLILISQLWVALLRHRRILVGTIHGPLSFRELVKASTGGQDLTFRQWQFPLRISELPTAYHFCWVITIILIGAIIDRWYLGLKWFDLVPSELSVRLFVALCGQVIVFATYFYSLWHALPTEMKR